jgi:hypothetical protein
MGIELIAVLTAAAASGLVSGLLVTLTNKRTDAARKELTEEQQRLKAIMKLRGENPPAPRFVEYETPNGVREFKLDVTNTDNVRDFVRVMQENADERVAGAR